MDFAAGAQTEHAPAKVNLALHVVDQRPDGYHLIESLSVFTEFGDGLVVTQAPRDSFAVSGAFAHQVPTGPDNLVLRARDAFRQRYPHLAALPVAIALQKNIPVTSGIGGGSSDAAATLRALCRLFSFDDDGHKTLLSLAPALGADVPMCLEARPLIARGIGEVIETLDDFPHLHLVLVNPGIAVETPRVFSALRTKHNASMPPLPDLPDLDAVVTWLGRTRNDLAPPAMALALEIGEVLLAFHAAGAAFARMSGSGATCFGLFADAASAAGAAESLRQEHPGWFVTATQTRH